MLSEVIADCPLIISDLWGVLHDGVRAHDTAVSSLLAAKEQGHMVALLSNAPKSVPFVEKFINAIGVEPTCYDLLVTSGSIARDHLRNSYHGAAVYHLGPSYDEEMKENIPVSFVKSVADADVILTTGLIEADGPTHTDMLREAAEREVEMIIANPDRVVHIGDNLQLCAGVVGDAYEQLGGPVFWCGKPTRAAYETVASRAGLTLEDLKDKALMIGDSLKTDIAGAKAAEIKSLFITDGIHRDDKIFHNASAPSVAMFHSVLGLDKPVPDYWMTSLM